MARRKVQLAYIVNRIERNASYKKRKKGLIKKVSELSALCDVESCAIIYNPYDQAKLEVWPSRLGAQAVLNRLNSLPEVVRTRKMFNQESYTRMRIKKAEDQLARLRRENRRMMLENFLYQCATGVASFDSSDPCDTTEMQLIIREVLQDLNSRMEAMRKDGKSPPRHPDADPPSAPPQPDVGPSNSALAVATQAPLTDNAAPFLTTMSQAAPLYLPGPSVTTISQTGPPYNLPGPSFAADMSQPAPSSSSEHGLYFASSIMNVDAPTFEAGPSFPPSFGPSTNLRATNQAWQPFEAGPSAMPVVSSQALITPPPPVEMEVPLSVSLSHNLLDSFPFNLLQSSSGTGFQLHDEMHYWSVTSAETTAMALDPAPFGINSNFSSETLPTYAGGSRSMDPNQFVWDDHYMLPSHVDFNFANALPPPPPPSVPSAAAAVATTTVDATATPHTLPPNNNSRHN